MLVRKGVIAVFVALALSGCHSSARRQAHRPRPAEEPYAAKNTACRVYGYSPRSTG